ncbi:MULTISPECIES: DMT family transporter [Paenibacillus]|uniref:Transporter family-2 protein n=1 Tax=Paenibacillus barengoltzii J12 TaxID=935846 RepID=A0ABY1LXI9_9BACL|nr:MULTISPECIES: DMT family transporter [Paenibacillus]MCT2194041.1 DMT family transporter [Paenibacillus sp. p3-SID1389]MEC2345451.1 DMT family transporter [Paenibacillus barengoltzii]SMF26792.1 transporter family-2 protein [Paenibacillus barengoltzii J12]
MLLGIMFALTAGALVGMQNVFNTKVNEQTGNWTTTTLVLGLGFAASFVIGLIVEGKGMFTSLPGMPVWFWFSGLIGVGVVTCMVQGVKLLGPTYAVAIVMTSELGFALLFDSLGWLGLQKVPFTLNQLIGVLVIVGGIFVFKLGGGSESEEESSVRKREALN